MKLLLTIYTALLIIILLFMGIVLTSWHNDYKSLTELQYPTVLKVKLVPVTCGTLYIAGNCSPTVK